MPYAGIIDAPATEEAYRSIREKLGDEAPKGLVIHLAVKVDGGLRYIDVWDTEADWLRFRDERLEPAVTQTLDEFGIPRPTEHPSQQTLQVVGVWKP